MCGSRLFQHPFRVHANIRIREQDFNSRYVDLMTSIYHLRLKSYIHAEVLP